MLLDWVAFLAKSDLVDGEHAAAIAAMALSYRAGALPYERFVSGVMTAYARALRGAPVDAVREKADEFAETDARRLFPIAEPLIGSLKRAGLSVILISGEPLEPLESHAARLGLGNVVGSKLAVRDGAYTGRLLRNVAARRTKAGAVAALAKGHLLAFAAGDREADAAMVNMAQVGAFVGADGAPLPPSFRADVTRLSPTANAEALEQALSPVQELADLRREG